VLAHAMNSMAKRAVEGGSEWALTSKDLVQGRANPSDRTLAFWIIGCRGNVRHVGKNNVARSADASMSAFEIRPERPPHGPF